MIEVVEGLGFVEALGLIEGVWCLVFFGSYKKVPGCLDFGRYLLCVGICRVGVVPYRIYDLRVFRGCRHRVGQGQDLGLLMVYACFVCLGFRVAWYCKGLKVFGLCRVCSFFVIRVLRMKNIEVLVGIFSAEESH